jgi:hypothetical protein
LVLSNTPKRFELRSARFVVVALVVVEFPITVRLPFIVLEAAEINPAVSVESPVTLKVEEKVEAPVCAVVPWKSALPEVVAFPLMVRPPVPDPFPMVEDALAINPLWKRWSSEVVAPPKMVSPVPRVPPPIVVEAVMERPEEVALMPALGWVHAS